MSQNVPKKIREWIKTVDKTEINNRRPTPHLPRGLSRFAIERLEELVDFPRRFGSVRSLYTNMDLGTLCCA